MNNLFFETVKNIRTFFKFVVEIISVSLSFITGAMYFLANIVFLRNGQWVPVTIFNVLLLVLVCYLLALKSKYYGGEK